MPSTPIPDTVLATAARVSRERQDIATVDIFSDMENLCIHHLMRGIISETCNNGCTLSYGYYCCLSKAHTSDFCPHSTDVKGPKGYFLCFHCTIPSKIGSKKPHYGSNPKNCMQGYYKEQFTQFAWHLWQSPKQAQMKESIPDMFTAST